MICDFNAYIVDITDDIHYLGGYHDLDTVESRYYS